MSSLVCAKAANSKHRLRCNDRGSRVISFVLTMPPKKKLKRLDNQGLISNLFKSSTQDKPFNPVSSQTLPGPVSDKQPVMNVTESDSRQIVDRVSSSSEQSLPSTSDENLSPSSSEQSVCLKLVYRLK